MEQLDETLAGNPNLSCKVCGEKEFEEREGFYFCQECGTKQDQIRAIVVEDEDDFNNEKKKTKKIKLKTVKTEKPQLTSWECYNYILRGYVEDLLSFGAKEELKLMTLQVWAAYLRRIEVAFFNRKQADLPKLGIIYLQNDAETIYNHRKIARKKRRNRRAGGGSTSGGSGLESTSMSARDFNRSKRKLDESIYSLTTASGTSGATGLSSFSSGNTNKAIRLVFNRQSRKLIKKKMPIKHLKKHEIDEAGVLECHQQPKSREINSVDYTMISTNLRHVFSVLAIALNLIEDDIQLTDLIRFINEGHIGPKNVLQYFPQNIANNGHEILKKINFHKNPDRYSEKVLREYTVVLSKHIGIRKFKTPSISKLIRRYATELCLPTEIATYCERLIKMLPPQFDTGRRMHYPGYEARAMAYIIFVLKLIFGLDGEKEEKMSQASGKLNRIIEDLNQRNNEKQPLLFVWSEWVQYIEMRKVIVANCNPKFCEQFKQCQSTTQLLEQMAEDVRRNKESNDLIVDDVAIDKSKQRLQIFKGLFERFQENFKANQSAADEKKPMKYIEFKPSFTPAAAYFKSILLHCDNEQSLNSETYLNIPKTMRVDHTQRDAQAFLKVKPLIEYFRNHQEQLKVYVLPSTQNRSFVGIFRPPHSQYQGAEAVAFRAQKPNFDITEKEWASNLDTEVCNRTEDLEFKTNLESFKDNYYKRKTNELKKKTNQLNNKEMNFDLPPVEEQYKDTPDLPQTSSKNRKVLLNLSDGHDIESMHSFDLFRENNMDPIQTKDFVKRPRRNLDQINLFNDISDEESVLNDVNDEDGDSDTASISSNYTSLEDCPPPDQDEFIKTEIRIKEEFLDADIRGGDQINNSNADKDKNHHKSLKMYVSNMDCWMLLGNFRMVTKLQRSQLQSKFPPSFNWLLETCAQTLNVDWSSVYEHLMCIEVMFCLGIDDPEKIKNCIYMKSLNPCKDYQSLVNTYREMW